MLCFVSSLDACTVIANCKPTDTKDSEMDIGRVLFGIPREHSLLRDSVAAI